MFVQFYQVLTIWIARPEERSATLLNRKFLVEKLYKYTAYFQSIFEQNEFTLPNQITK